MPPEPSRGGDRQDRHRDREPGSYSPGEVDQMFEHLTQFVQKTTAVHLLDLALEHRLRSVSKGTTRVRRLDPMDFDDKDELSKAVHMDDLDQEDLATVVYAVDYAETDVDPIRETWVSDHYVPHEEAVSLTSTDEPRPIDERERSIEWDEHGEYPSHEGTGRYHTASDIVSGQFPVSDPHAETDPDLSESPFSEGDSEDYYDLDAGSVDRTGRGPRS